MTLTEKITQIANDYKLKSLANSYGLDISTVTWEDTARTKGSCMGPNISDMTLHVEPYNMPVIRKPNFADVTADQPIENFTVVVGNHNGSELKQISLKDYLENLCNYSDAQPHECLLKERDSVILTSAQSCILPLDNGSVEFCVQLYNYQSNYDKSDPAVLVIMSNSEGTSVQVVYGTTKLYFNNNGTAFNLKAERLSDDRKKRGVEIDGPMTDEEKNKNALFIYQIPLKQMKKSRYGSGCMLECYSFEGSFEGSIGGTKLGCRPPCLNNSNIYRGFEKAIISKGTEKGIFNGISNIKLVRDERFPIRCTVQYYNVTDNPTISEDQLSEIAKTISNTYDTANYKGSLVLTEKSDRKTEPK